MSPAPRPWQCRFGSPESPRVRKSRFLYAYVCQPALGHDKLGRSLQRDDRIESFWAWGWPRKRGGVCGRHARDPDIASTRAG